MGKTEAKMEGETRTKKEGKSKSSPGLCPNLREMREEPASCLWLDPRDALKPSFGAHSS